MNGLIEWYLYQMPRYIRRWKGVEGYGYQVEHAEMILASIKFIKGHFPNMEFR